MVLPDQTPQRIEGILDGICLIVDGSYVTADFVILNIGRNPKAPIILGLPFIHTIKASIYIASDNMCFDINGKKRRFSFNPPYPRRHSSRVNRVSLDDVDSIEIVKMKFYQEPIIKGWQDIS